jgi:sn-glycerol 3-phosphate transport system substrate-binding protein
MDARLKVDSPLHVKHIENLSKAAAAGEFVYKGRGSNAQASFTAGECAMIQTSSGFYGDVAKNAKFAYGLAPLPYYADVKGAPQNTVIGGASLWVMSGKKAEEYKGVAKFFDFLSQTKVQAASHQRTGYLPITMAAYDLTDKSGFYQKNPGTDIAVQQMVRKVTDKSRGIRLGNYVQIRTIEDEEMEQVWSGKKSAKDALDAIVKRGNELLVRFEQANSKK